MTPERYRQINALADAALQMTPAKRAVFLGEVCGSDHELRTQVEALLTAEASANDFLEKPLLEVLAGDLAAHPQERDLSGLKIANYEVLTRLGAGGIGEVWLARDLRLDREIALKLLSPKFAGDPYHLHRFQQEARTASSLNHPNIITVHEIGEADGLLFIAEERVAGETVRQMLAKGPIPLQQTADIGMQAATALGAAHAAGVIHRDIKPENAMLRPDGLLKLLDFGLARFGRGSVQEASDAAESGSLHGFVVGTVRYMSPEQARGLAVDGRSDIFSLGVMLYEMACGVPPFSGATPTDTLAAILTSDPAPLSRVMKQASPEFERIVRRCLAKDPAQRYPTAEALQADLAKLASGPTRNERWRWPWFLAVAAAGIIAMLSLMMNRREAPATFSSMQLTRLATHGAALDAAISRDGKLLGYVTATTLGQSLWVKNLAQGDEREVVTAAAGEHSGLTFAPDDKALYYRRRSADGKGDLYRVALPEGTPQRVLGDISGAAAFSPDGRRLAFVRLNPLEWEASLIVAYADGSGAYALATLQRPKYFDQHTVAWSPDGKSIACFSGEGASYAASEFHLVSVSVADGHMRRLSGQVWQWPRAVAWAAKGNALVVTAAMRGDDIYQLWMVHADSGNASRITNDLTNYDRVTLTEDGKSVVSLQSETLTSIWVAASDGSGRFVKMNAEPLRSEHISLAWTKDERLVYSDNASGFRNLFLSDADGTNRRAITADDVNKDQCVMSHDGRFLVCKQAGNIWRIEMDGSGARQLTHGSLDVHPSISADDKTVVYASFTNWSPAIGGEPTLWRIPSNGGAAVEISRQPGSYPAESPEGRQLAFIYFPGRDPRFSTHQIATLALDGSNRFTVFEASPSDETAIAWSPEGDAVDYVLNARGVGNVWRQPTQGGPAVAITKFDSDELYTFAWSSNGRLACVRGNTTGSVIQIQNFH